MSWGKYTQPPPLVYSLGGFFCEILIISPAVANPRARKPLVPGGSGLGTHCTRGSASVVWG